MLARRKAAQTGLPPVIPIGEERKQETRYFWTPLQTVSGMDDARSGSSPLKIY